MTTTHTRGPMEAAVRDLAYLSEVDGLLLAAREQDAIRADLLEALEAAHGALDTLLAMLILRDASFKPSHSPVWPAVVQAGAAIAKARGA